MTKFQYLKRLLSFLPMWSKATGYSVIRLALAYAVCFIFHGANSEEFWALRLYKYNNRERRRILLIRATERFSDCINAGATAEELACFDEKAHFNAVFADYIRRDWLYVPDSTPEQIRAFLARTDKFLAKACVSTQGKNIYLHYSADTDPDSFLREYEGKPFLLESFITQHPDMAALNPSTVNTVRILTMRHGDDVVPLGACLRCGGADAYVDNFHSGGVAYPIDLETGVVSGPGRTLLGLDLYIRHPSTGKVMPGFRIPYWDELLRTVSAAAVIVPHVGFVGWDVAILPDGVALVEGNINYPDPIVVQLDEHGVKSTVKDFLKKHGL